MLPTALTTASAATLPRWPGQRAISSPLSRSQSPTVRSSLAETARAVSDRRDYSVRATCTGGHELGLLTDAFNHMLTQIQEQHGKLKSQLGNLQLLQHITRAIGERQDLPSLFRVVLSSLEDSLPIDFGCICLSDGANLQVASVGIKSTALAAAMQMTEHTQVPIDSNGLSRCMKGELVYEPDVREVPFPFPQRLAGFSQLCQRPSQQIVRVEVLGTDLGGLRQRRNRFLKAAGRIMLQACVKQAGEILRQQQSD